MICRYSVMREGHGFIKILASFDTIFPDYSRIGVPLLSATKDCRCIS